MQLCPCGRVDPVPCCLRCPPASRPLPDLQRPYRPIFVVMQADKAARRERSRLMGRAARPESVAE
eukprot:scaffold18905_cov129-Isochrysis_galbana.AAC.3